MCISLTCEVAEAVVVHWATVVWPLGSSGAERLFLVRVLAREGCQTGRCPRDRPWLWRSCHCAFSYMGYPLLLPLPYLASHSNPQQEPGIIPEQSNIWTAHLSVVPVPEGLQIKIANVQCSINSCISECNRMLFNCAFERLSRYELWLPTGIQTGHFPNDFL